MIQNPPKQYPQIPGTLIWAGCITFAMLYAIWIIYELLYFRRILLISGAVLSLYPIYQYRHHFFQKRATPAWLMGGLFLWALFHLFFLAYDYPAQLMELRRIWKYAALSSVFGLGLGISLSRVDHHKNKWPWSLIYIGLSFPILIYLLRFFITNYMVGYSHLIPDGFKIFNHGTGYYVPKTDYIAFCLPTLAISLGGINQLINRSDRLQLRQYIALLMCIFMILSALFLFFQQNTKNGVVYSIICIIIFFIMSLLSAQSRRLWSKVVLSMLIIATLVTFIYPHYQKNDSWNTLIADSKIGIQIDKYNHWMHAGAIGYPLNELGKEVSITNYERVAWARAGIRLVLKFPLGYGLVEDSFARMVRAEWSDASPNLSHSHSGWLDILLGLGLPGVLCILSALVLIFYQAKDVSNPSKSIIYCSLFANIILWVTTEVAATVTFCAFIFWISFSAGLVLINPIRGNVIKE